MAKYFIDTEFIEGFHKPLFGKKRHFIDLISIGIVAEDGREYYAISNEWNYNDADKWVQENVIHKLPLKLMKKESVKDFKKRCKLSPADNVVWVEGKSNKQIAEEIIQFVNPPSGENSLNYKSWNNHLNKFRVVAAENRPIEFFGYFADYDWCLFCSLFGRMIDLPKGFPMYCKDLKQTFDYKVELEILKLNLLTIKSDYYLKKYDGYQINKEGISSALKSKGDYPKQENEHNALVDAKWNKELYEFLNTL